MPSGFGVKDTDPQLAGETSVIQQTRHSDDRRGPPLGEGDHKVELQNNSILRSLGHLTPSLGSDSLTPLLQSFIASSGPPPTSNPYISSRRPLIVTSHTTLDGGCILPLAPVLKR